MERSMFVYKSETSEELGHARKRKRPNPTGQDVYLHPDGTIEKDEDKIIAAQRIFKHEYYKEDGKGFHAAMKRLKEKNM
jgi:hypothetical protein